jgi:enoyl-CoA hydratase/carnithine racemase
MREATAGDAIAVEEHEGVRVLVLDRPQQLNAFTAVGYRALAEQLALAAEDRSVSVCVLTGRGRAFSAGVDLHEASRAEAADELGAQFDLLLEALARFPKPLVAAVNGPAVGFGATVLLHCDLVVVDETATIRLPFVQLGTCAEAGSSWLLPLRVGAQHAAWMLLSGASISADDAVSTGLAFTRCPAGGSLDTAVALAHQLAANQLDALVANKRLLRQGFAEHIGAAWQREKAAMAAVAETLGPIAWPATGGGASAR